MIFFHLKKVQWIQIDTCEMCEHAVSHKHKPRHTSRAHVNEGVVDQDQFVEVELVREPLAFGLVEDSLVVVVPGGKTIKQT